MPCNGFVVSPVTRGWVGGPASEDHFEFSIGRGGREEGGGDRFNAPGLVRGASNPSRTGDKIDMPPVEKVFYGIGCTNTVVAGILLFDPRYGKGIERNVFPLRIRGLLLFFFSNPFFLILYVSLETSVCLWMPPCFDDF